MRSTEIIACYLTPFFKYDHLLYHETCSDKNTVALNRLVDQAMQWVDTKCVEPVIVPLTCWIKPPLSPLALALNLPDWPKDASMLIRHTMNYQYLMVAGSHSPHIMMIHVASNTLVKMFKGIRN